MPATPDPTDPPPARAARAVLVATLLLVFCWAAAPNTTNDLYWHIDTGRYLAEHGGFPDRDPFSFTAGDQRWFLHEWLTQRLFDAVHQVAGLYGLRLLTGLMAVVILLLVHRLARREVGPRLGVTAVLLFLVLGAGRIQTRPTLFSIALFLAIATRLSDIARPLRGRDRLALAAATLLWVNLHSVGLLAPALVAAFCAGETVQHLTRGRLGRQVAGRQVIGHALTLAAVAGATLLTPAGTDLLAFALQDKSALMQFIADEWAPFHLLYGDNEQLTLPAYLAILAVLAFLLAFYLAAGVALTHRRRATLRSGALDSTRLLLLLLCVGLGLSARRFNWMLVLPAIWFPGSLRALLAAGALASRPLLPRRLAAAAVAAAQLGLLATVYHRELRYLGAPLHRVLLRSEYYTDGDCAAFHLGGVRFMKAAGLRGNAFCHYGSGGILSYHLYPAIRVFIDSRIDLYRRAIYLDYLAVANGRPDQNEILDRYGTDIYYRHWDLARLRDPKGWLRVYAGPDGEVWLRRTERNRDNYERCKRLAANATPAGRH